MQFGLFQVNLAIRGCEGGCALQISISWLCNARRHYGLIGSLLLIAAAPVLWLGATPANKQVPPNSDISLSLDRQVAVAEQAETVTKEQLLNRYPKASSKLRGKLLPLLDKRERLGRSPATAYAAKYRLPASDDRVTVIIVPTSNTAPGALVPSLVQEGAEIIRTGRTAIKAKVPISSLQRLGRDIAQIDHIRFPATPELHVTSQGVQQMNADGWTPCNYTGTGAKIGVIDLGFIGLASAQAAGELPAGVIEVDESGTGMEAGTVHGVAVAEVVHDMAPDAELHLIKIADELDLEAAKDYCKANGIDVVNHSVGWSGFNFYDGIAYSSMAPSPVGIADDANANGILWINSAGNSNGSHWRGPWADDDGDDWLDLDTSAVEVNQLGFLANGTTIVVFLTWNDWPTTDQDYDLYLMRFQGNRWRTAASSRAVQNGTQTPVEAFGFIVNQSANYAVAILKFSADGSHTFILRSFYQDFAFPTADGSIGCPADAASVLAVGAIRHSNYTTGPVESFSSTGPNNGSFTGNPTLIKPDVCGPDGNASWTYTSGFFGTSSSSPHVVGAAALVLSRFPSFTNSQIRSYLEGETLDLGAAGKDNIFGYGPVVLPDLPDSDGDGTLDCDDNCPNDPNKTEPGVCGCGVPETDTDGDTVPDCNDLCPNTIPGATVDANGCPPLIPGDFDRDGDVDEDDFDHFVACKTAPNVAQGNPSCQDADLDSDTDVDQEDFGPFQGCLSGTDIPADENCAD